MLLKTPNLAEISFTCALEDNPKAISQALSSVSTRSAIKRTWLRSKWTRFNETFMRPFWAAGFPWMPPGPPTDDSQDIVQAHEDQ